MPALGDKPGPAEKSGRSLNPHIFRERPGPIRQARATAVYVEATPAAPWNHPMTMAYWMMSDRLRSWSFPVARIL